MTHASFEARIRRIEAHHRDPGHLRGAVAPGVDEGAAGAPRPRPRNRGTVLPALRRVALSALWGALTLIAATSLGRVEAALATAPALRPWGDYILAAIIVVLVFSAAAIVALSLHSLLAPRDTPRLRQMMTGALAGVALTLAVPLLPASGLPALDQLHRQVLHLIGQGPAP